MSFTLDVELEFCKWLGVLPVDSRHRYPLLPGSHRRNHPLRHRGLSHAAPFALVLALAVMRFAYPRVRAGTTSWWGLLSWFFVITALHGVFDAMAILLSTTCGGLTLAPVAVLLVGWSRLYLKRYTFPPVLAGGVLGSMIFLVLLSH